MEEQKKVNAMTKIIRFIMTVGVDLFSVRSVVCSSGLERWVTVFTDCGSDLLTFVTARQINVISELWNGEVK